MKTLYIIIIIVCPTLVYSAQTDQWIMHLENSRYDQLKLKDKNFLSEYAHYDFSDLLKPRSKLLGFKGANYQRLIINVTSVSKRNYDPYVYDVNGYTIFNDVRCDFAGYIRIIQIREYQKMHFGVDDEFKNAGFKAQGLFLGKYKFVETPIINNCGVYKGVMTLYWLLDKNGSIRYDDIEQSFSDSYKNNQYIGTWVKHGDNKEDTCNWGEYRIPFSGDLDIGAAYFSVNPKYIRHGWQEFRNE